MRAVRHPPRTCTHPVLSCAAGGPRKVCAFRRRLAPQGVVLPRIPRMLGCGRRRLRLRAAQQGSCSRRDTHRLEECIVFLLDPLKKQLGRIQPVHFVDSPITIDALHTEQ